jgi:hypothetical protein
MHPSKLLAAQHQLMSSGFLRCLSNSYFEIVKISSNLYKVDKKNALHFLEMEK